jgi:SAM-dependent methyltransferase
VPKSEQSEPDWNALLESWDQQQDSCIPNRESKFEAMLDVLGTYLPKNFTALDLGSGPGSMSFRILRRFPKARVVAVDFDPVLLKIGKESSKQYGRRMTWVDADIGTAGWADQLPGRTFDAVVSSTAIHWLDRRRLRRLYEDLSKILRSGGILLNGDVLPWGENEKTLGKIAEKLRYARHGTLEVEFAPWHQWWEEVEREQKSLGPVFRQRKKRFAQSPAPEGMLPIELHMRLLQSAGFSEVGTMWQNLLEDRVLAAIR